MGARMAQPMTAVLLFSGMVFLAWFDRVSFGGFSVEDRVPRQDREERAKGGRLAVDIGREQRLEVARPRARPDEPVSCERSASPRSSTGEKQQSTPSKRRMQASSVSAPKKAARSAVSAACGTGSACRAIQSGRPAASQNRRQNFGSTEPSMT